MFHLPRTRNQWIIAMASALAGFFGGGAVVAFTQMQLRKVLH